MLSAIASPDIVSSNMHPRYLTFERSLICICPYFKWNVFIFFLLNLEPKRTNFVLFSPKCILRLLSTNQSNILQKPSSECNWSRTHNHLVHKHTLSYLGKLANHLPKWSNVRLWNKWLCGRFKMESFKLQISRRLRAIIGIEKRIKFGSLWDVFDLY